MCFNDPSNCIETCIRNHLGGQKDALEVIEGKVQAEWWEEMKRLKGVKRRWLSSYVRLAMAGTPDVFWRMIKQVEKDDGIILCGPPEELLLPELQNRSVKAKTGSLKLFVKTDSRETLESDILSPDFAIFAAVVEGKLQSQRMDSEIRLPRFQGGNWVPLALEESRSVSFDPDVVQVKSWELAPDVSLEKVRKSAASVQNMLRALEEDAWLIPKARMFLTAVFLVTGPHFSIDEWSVSPSALSALVQGFQKAGFSLLEETSTVVVSNPSLILACMGGDLFKRCVSAVSHAISKLGIRV